MNYAFIASGYNKNNVDHTLKEVLEFYESPAQLLAVNGFTLSGKYDLILSSLKFLNEDVLVFKYTCSKVTTLDDILLSFYNDFRNFHNLKKIRLKKISEENFAKKISFYFKSVKSPCLLILDELDDVFEYSAVINFLNHLKVFKNVKFAALTKKQIYSDFENFDTHRIKIHPLSIDLAKDFLNKSGIETTQICLDELYKASKGFRVYLNMCVYYLKAVKISLFDFLSEYNKRKKSFEEFLLSKIISLIPENYYELIWLLVSFRHPVPIDFLKKLSLVKDVEIQYLENISVINTHDNFVFMNESFKKHFDIPLYEQIKNHRFLATLYEKELNLKPFERDLMLSRRTMRKEKDYHLSLVPKDKEEWGKNSDKRMAYIAQSKAIQNPWTKIKPGEKFSSTAEKTAKDKIKKEKEEIEELLNLTKEELMLLSKEEREIYKNVAGQNKPENDIKSPEPLIEDAENLEKSYDWQNAVNKLEEALEKEEDSPKILTKLSLDYAKLGDFENAVTYAKRAISSYELRNEPAKALLAGLNLANFYRENYNYNNAKEYYAKIINTDFEIPTSLRGWAHLGIAEMNSDEMHYRHALDLALQSSDLSLISEVYFKTGLYFDDKGDYQRALKLYLKCIETSSDEQVNKNLSSAYFNVASIFFDEKNYEKAQKYYSDSIESDEKTDNKDGLYFAHLKLAAIYKKTSPQRVLDEILKAVDCAENMNDNFYSARAIIELGDWFYDKRQDSKALEAYLKAKEILKDEISDENEQKINIRINDIKAREQL